ncbi:GMC family oxidoreductase [Amycolatopsis sp. NPDC051758]|uniref:GMC family oxidoreductase n=1 Tax=Amycolatopsis sp. NPDC051758 TaxID=3363935 RepID=UPI0037B923A9
MYDYIVVGAGSAGTVVASRLSEDPDARVLLLEAGGQDTLDTIHIPALFGDLFRTSVDWDYDSHFEPGLDRRRIFIPRGKVLGGTSSINAMLYIRANPLDYNSWNQPGWSYDELLPLFRRAEDNERGESRYHGVGGPLRVSEGRSNNITMTALIEAALEAGHPANDDFNGESQDGFGRFQLTQRDGRRWSVADAYLRPALDRPNLTVVTNFHALRLTLDGTRVTGVTGERFGEELTFQAEAEVIVSGGAYNTPTLLMYSGIGPAGVLEGAGVDVAVDHPEVGRNLQDHLFVPLIYAHDEPVSTIAAGDAEMAEFFEHGTGPFTSNGPEGGGFIRTKPGLPAPDVSFYCGPMMFPDSGLSVPTEHAVTFGPVMLTPESRGQVSIIGADPTTKPKIEHNYLTTEDDRVVAVEGVRAALEIASQPALTRYTTRPYQVPASDKADDVLAFIRSIAHPIWHAGGSAAMGKVVDAELRVQGLEGLRIADTSVMPTIGRGATNASAIVIGERAADLIAGARTARKAA